MNFLLITYFVLINSLIIFSQNNNSNPFGQGGGSGRGNGKNVPIDGNPGSGKGLGISNSSYKYKISSAIGNSRIFDNRSNEIILETKFNYIQSITLQSSNYTSNPLFYVYADKLMGLFDAESKSYIIPFDNVNLNQITSDIFIGKNVEGFFSVYKLKNKTISKFDFAFENVSVFNDSLLKVTRNLKQGLLNSKTMELILEPKYDDISKVDLHLNRYELFKIQLNNKIGFIDMHMKEVYSPIYDDIQIVSQRDIFKDFDSIVFQGTNVVVELNDLISIVQYDNKYYFQKSYEDFNEKSSFYDSIIPIKSLVTENKLVYIVLKDLKYGVLNSDFNISREIKYDSIYPVVTKEDIRFTTPTYVYLVFVSKYTEILYLDKPEITISLKKVISVSSGLKNLTVKSKKRTFLLNNELKEVD